MKKKNFKKSVAAALALAAACSVPSFAGPGLADGAAKFVGNITQSNSVPGPNDQFTQLWNQATAENGCKWGSIEGTRGQYNWTGCDAAYKWAKNNGGHFKFHALLWGSQYPNWLPSLSVDDTKKAITEWFDAVKKQYPDLEMIDVANEAIRTSTGYHSNYKNTKIIEAMGGDNNDYAFLVTAFKMARERWPDAILIYNDYNTIQWDVDGGINLINTLVKAKAPIDGYGLQAHDLMSTGGNYNGTGGGGNCMNYSSFTSTMEKIHKQTNNIPIFISEYDVPSTDDNIQEQCVSEQFKYWMEDPYVAGITFWGYIYGQTWLDCNKTASGCSGLIKNGQDRKAMTWLRNYLATNKGANETGLIGGEPIPPEPQTPYGGKAAVIPGKIEAENFDVPGKGRNEDGTSNASYSVANSGKGDSDYRKDESPNLYKGATGVVIGFNNNDNWYEYTVDVAETGSYTMYAAVASGAGGAFTLSIDGKAITESISVPAAAGGTDVFTEYNKVSADVNLTKGQHILRLTVDKEYFDIDYMTFVAQGSADPEPIGGDTPASSESKDPAANPASSSSEEVGIAQNLKMEYETRQDFDIFDMQGTFMGRLGGYSFDQAINTVKNSDVKFANGTYYMRNKDTKQMTTFTIAK